MADCEVTDGSMRCVPLLSVHVHAVTMAEALEQIHRFVEAGGPHQVVTLDASMCVAARTDSELRRIVCEAELVTPDSAGILWAARRLGMPLKERVSGVDIVEQLAARSRSSGLSLYLLGAEPGVAAQAGERLKAAYPGCRIVGTHHGYFTEEDEEHVVQAIVACKPDILCVALGIPKQEKWIARHRDALRVPVMIGVGGTLDVLSGRTQRAPVWMQRTNLEWLYRVLANPRKVGKVMTLPRFVAMVLAQGQRART